MRRIHAHRAGAVLAALLVLACTSVHAQTLRVLTYNAGLLRALGSDYVPLVDARAAHLPRWITDSLTSLSPDVLLLEEVWNPNHAEALGAVLERSGYTVVRPADRGLLLGLTSGLLLGVKRPLEVVDWEFRRFRTNTFLEGFARKGVLGATVRTAEGRRFEVIATHMVALDTVNREPSVPAQVRVFRAQADQVLATLERRTEGRTHPALVLGDFNVGPLYAEAEYRRIADARGVREAGAAFSPGGPHVTWDPENPLVKHGEYPHEPPAKIDHVFLADGSTLAWSALGAEVVFREPLPDLVLTPEGGTPVATPMSDHYGFLAVVALEAGR